METNNLVGFTAHKKLIDEAIENEAAREEGFCLHFSLESYFGGWDGSFSHMAMHGC